VTTNGAADGLEDGLRVRFRAAGAKIAWREVPRPSNSRRKRPAAAASTVRIAHLNDEEARVEEVVDGNAPRLVVDSGPVGALVLVLRWDERGPPSRLVTHEAGALEGFATGALEAEWGGRARPSALAVPLTDLVALARYALA
jgi:hypothetical protein